MHRRLSFHGEINLKSGDLLEVNTEADGSIRPTPQGGDRSLPSLLLDQALAGRRMSGRRKYSRQQIVEIDNVDDLIADLISDK
jgi:hypothetical protein